MKLENFLLRILLFILTLMTLFLGLNYRQVYSIWTIQHEMKRLTALAEQAPQDFPNPPAMTDRFDDKLASNFWKFTVIDGAGQVSHASSWHAAAISINHGLSLKHIADSEFGNESPGFTQTPAPEQYNNVALIGRTVFRPTPSDDVLLTFSAMVSKPFYGTAGVIFQPVGTLQQDGAFVKPFDMFGFSVIGDESAVLGKHGSVCYLALNWIPAQVNTLATDAYSWHTYEIRLHWISQTEWLGSLKVDNMTQCQMLIPAFGPVEVQVWSDNAWVVYHPRQWWELADSMDLKLQNGHEKQFQLGMLQIAAESNVDQVEEVSVIHGQ